MNKFFISILGLASILVLAGCNTTKNTGTTAIATPEQFRFANSAANDSNSIATLPWNQFFTDTALLKLIDSAIHHNYDMQLALKNIAAAQLQVKQAKLGYLPTAQLQVGASVNRPSDNSLNGISLSQFLGKSYVEDYSTSVQLSWEADIWGKIKQQQSIARNSYLQSNEARKAVQTNLVATVAKNYYDLLMLDAQVAIAKKNLLLNDSTLRILQLQFDAGEVTALAVQQATAQKLVAAQLVPQLEQLIAVTENALSYLSGVAPAAIQRTTFSQQPSAAQLPVGVPATLISNRPDVQSNELAIRLASANIALSKAAMYPSLNITAAGGVNAFKASNWFNIPGALFGTIAGGITQPLFQRKQLKTQYELNVLNKEKAVIKFKQSVLLAVQEVSDALVKTAKNQAQAAIATQRVSTLQAAIQNASLLFNNGLANYLEVITAQANVLQGELELAVLKRDQLNAVVDLYRAVGGGWR